MTLCYSFILKLYLYLDKLLIFIHYLDYRVQKKLPNNPNYRICNGVKKPSELLNKPVDRDPYYRVFTVCNLTEIFFQFSF